MCVPIMKQSFGSEGYSETLMVAKVQLETLNYELENRVIRFLNGLRRGIVQYVQQYLYDFPEICPRMCILKVKYHDIVFTLNYIHK